MLLDECVGKDVLHVTGVEVAVGDVVVGGVDLCIFDSFRNIFDTDYLGCLTGNELSDCTCACIKVIYYFGACQSGIFACNAVKLVSLFCICLVEGLRTDLELQAFHIFIDCIFTLVEHTILI